MDIAHLLSSASFLAPSTAVGMRSLNATKSIAASHRAVSATSHHECLGGRLGVATAMAMGSEAREEPDAGRDPPSPMRLVDLIRYPVKSCRGEALAEAVVTAEGLEGDRRFLVTAADGRYQTQREWPALATVEARVLGDSLQLRAQTAARPLNVTIRRTGPLTAASLFGSALQLTDQGPEAAAWLSEVIVGGGGGGGGGAGASSFNPFAKLQEALFGPPLKLLRAPDPVPGSPSPLRGGAGLADLSPLLLVCEESLNALNAKRLSEGKLPAGMDRFRPNLVLRGCGVAHAEDTWTSLSIGGARFRVTGQCPRCGVPDVAQSTGVRDAAGAGPMSTLKSYRSRAGAGVLFGIYITPVGSGGSVRVGDAVEAV
jgi:uncharacterized protein